MTNEEALRKMMTDLAEGVKASGKYFDYNRDTRKLEPAEAGAPNSDPAKMRMKPEDMNLG